MAETHLFQTKLKLIIFVFKEAQRLLIQALDIAEKYGLNLLVKQILNEQEELTRTLKKWDNLKSSEAKLATCIDLAGLNNQIRLMLKNRGKF